MKVGVVIIFILATAFGTGRRSFSIDFANNRFLKDGSPYRYVSGEMHYFRVPEQYWDERMRKIRLAGFNALATYVEWFSHEPEEGVYNFHGNMDLEKYLTLAHNNGLDVILRPGPYIDASRDLGGYPYWLLRDHPDIKLRTKDPIYMSYVYKWFHYLFTKIKKFLYKNGGPIIAMQVENEYGSFGDCDKEYMSKMRDIYFEHFGPDIVLLTADGPGLGYINCGNVAEVYATVNFGAGDNVSEYFHNQRIFEPKGPLINSEYYPGWENWWQTPHSKVPSEIAAKTLDEILAIGANVNMYVVHGGTSFGFTAGSNTRIHKIREHTIPFESTITSYDYDAPITEAGDLTEKFWAIRKTIGKYLPLPEIPSNLKNTSAKGDYGIVKMKYVSTIFDSREILLRTKAISDFPLSFEDISQNAGFVLYETVIADHHTDPAILSIPGIRDRGYVFVNSRPRGILSRSEEATSLPIQVDQGDTLQIVVENRGRDCYGKNFADRKGIIGNVTLGSTVLSNWIMLGLPLSDTRMLEKYVTTTVKNKNKRNVKKLVDSLKSSGGKMTFWVGEFTIPPTKRYSQYPLDTFLNPDGWHKGVAFINGVNLGRYWPVAGPQRNLYVPGVWLKPHPYKNTIILLEQDKPACFNHHVDPNQERCVVKFVTEPDLDGPTPSQREFKYFTKYRHHHSV